MNFNVNRYWEKVNDIDISLSMAMNTRMATEVSEESVDKKPQSLQEKEFFQ